MNKDQKKSLKMKFEMPRIGFIIEADISKRQKKSLKLEFIMRKVDK